MCAPRSAGRPHVNMWEETMNRYSRYGIAALLALGLAGGGVAAGAALAVPVTSNIPTSCIAPLDGGTYKVVADGDAERYTDGVYQCVKGMWVLNPDYGQ